MHAASDAILDVEFLRGPLADKYVDAAKALSNRFDKGSLPFQDFERVIALRNAIMHARPVRPNEKHSGEAVTDELARRNIALSGGPVKLPWFDRLMTPEVARWACRSARTMILDLFSKIPVGAPDAFELERRLYSDNAPFESEVFV